MKTKRIHYPVNKAKIEEAIYWYNKYDQCDPRLNDEYWDKHYEACSRICPQAYVRVMVCSLIQAMHFANNLTVDNVYYSILASGANTRLEEEYD